MTVKLLLAGKEISDFLPIKMAFAGADATVITSTSMALALFLARKNLPDIIIAQNELTDSAGLALFYELRNEQELENIPFVILKTDRQKTNDDMLNEYTAGAAAAVRSLFLESKSSSDISYLEGLKEEILAIMKDQRQTP